MTDDAKLWIWAVAFFVMALVVAAIGIVTTLYPGTRIDPSIIGALTPIP